MTVDLFAAEKLSAQHIAGHDRPRDEYLPECARCHEYMELDAGDEPTAFCHDCVYQALDVLAEAVPALIAELRAVQTQRDGLRALVSDISRLHTVSDDYNADPIERVMARIELRRIDDAMKEPRP